MALIPHYNSAIPTSLACTILGETRLLERQIYHGSSRDQVETPCCPFVGRLRHARGTAMRSLERRGDDEITRGSRLS